jgi:hypothetical protein
MMKIILYLLPFYLCQLNTNGVPLDEQGVKELKLLKL